MGDLRVLVPWWNIFYNYELLRHIFQYLNLNEQIVLLDVCEQFEFVVSKLIWKQKYRTLHLHQTPYVTIINDSPPAKEDDDSARDDVMELTPIQQSKVALKLQQCKRFLVANATNVQYLRVHSEYYDFKGSLGVTLNKVQMFRNLLHLSYYKMVVTNEQVELIARYCTILQKLEFIECSCGDLQALMLGDYIKLDSFVSMSRLETLIMKSDPALTAPQNEMDSEFLLSLLNGMKLKCIILKNVTITDSNWLEQGSGLEFAGSNMLEILDLGCISTDFWPKFKNYLKNCTNLRDLSIKVTNCNTAFNYQMVEILAATCPHLEKLSLENCDLIIENFCFLESLKQLSLSSCGGLTFANLQQIMGGLQLERFTLINTRVLGDIYHIYVAPTLQSITIDTILFTVISEAFEKSLNKFENLHTLNWLNGDINDNWIIDKCPNLKVLNVPNPYLLRRVVFTMKSLQEFTFTSCKGLSWRFIWILVKNMNLKRLNLQTHDTIHDHKEIPEGASNTTTTLEMITIPFGIFKMAMEFWLDLLELNDHLKILFYGSQEELMNTNFIYNLFRHRHRPKRLKSMKICGYTVDFNDLHFKFMEVLQQLNTNTIHYRTRNMKYTIEI